VAPNILFFECDKSRELTLVFEAVCVLELINKIVKEINCAYQREKK
jgi:hypothetical protein